MELGRIRILKILENIDFCLISRGIGWNRDFEDFGNLDFCLISHGIG